MAEVVGLLVLVVVLAGAIRRPFGLNEAVFGVPAALLVVLVGVVPRDDALDRIGSLTPTVLFLAGILAFGHLCAEEGVFDYLGAVTGRASGGRSRRLLLLTVLLAAAVTTVLTLDATVVLLTPVVLRTVQRLGVRGRPHLYACIHLANAGSLLLPVSNLTNLLAFDRSGLSFGRFTGLMLLPFLAVVLLEWLALRVFFRSDLPAGGDADVTVPPVPRYALGVLGVTVVGFVVTSAVDVPPAWAALGGVLLLGVPRLLRRRTTAVKIVAEANIGFCLFVLTLGVVVDAVTRHGLGQWLGDFLPDASGDLATLLLLAAVSAVLANLVNNIPATLVMVGLTAGHPAAVLAVLLGVNIGPNLTYVGSLATLLWRRLLPDDERPGAVQFHLLGVLSVPVVLVVATTLLWVSTLVLL
ncbi:SLC13 family permease [Jatrophihabitans sp. YIM 134969]